ncbi:unannotated protein [freshwater metagenome]|uniref:Unannotated protein n=1 Tax=freshwater metagenome TaxID=449393 RepID=A0A6J7CKN1_9ZZZZ
MTGKSPMKTVWDLISPVMLLVNSAVTKSGCEYVVSRSLQCSMEYLGGSKRWSLNDRLIVPCKSSIGEISSKISSNPDCFGSSPRLVTSACARRSRHTSLPNNQSTLSICSAKRLGTSRGSRIFAKEIRRGATDLVFDAAKECPSEQF